MTEQQVGPTPGPWSVEADESGIYILMSAIKGNDEHLAVYAAPYGDGTPSARRVADAHLIAAAPTLLAAAEAAVAFMETTSTHLADCEHCAVIRLLGEAIQSARAIGQEG